MTKQPSYRFADYDEPWEEKKLGEVAELLNGRAYKQEELLEDGEYRVLRVGNFNTNDRWYYSDLQLEDSKYANYGDLLYLWATNFGPELWKEEKVIYHYHIWKISGYSNILDKYYFYTFLEKDKNRIKQNTNGSTMVHITKGMMEERVLTFPSLPEQTAIGSFFQNIDQLISLQQRKLEVLKDQKKTYLKLLFPAKGQPKPALRFAGFKDEWKKVKLGEVYSFSQGQQVPVEEQFEQINENRIRFIRIVDLTNKGEEMRYIEFKSSTGRVYEKDIFFVRYGAVGVVGIGYDGIIANNLFKLNPQMSVDNKFMYVQFNREKFKKTLQGFSASTTMPAISFTDIRTIDIYLPSLPEQEVISSFFQDLDKAIAKQEGKVNQLKESKQTLLRKMFI